ncbi:MAG: hypothetical protein A2Y33_14625 [Spirochaetes bacterium GWF1_51_8]|nr:MAG: hypothetical protein A2Y33_14625 [Spirochaetes bacterium GWF1_51_8]
MKSKFLKILNPILFAAALFQMFTITIIKLQSWAVLEAPAWIYEAHEINGLVLIGLIVIHIVLNWPWIKTNIFKIKAK